MAGLEGTKPPPSPVDQLLGCSFFGCFVSNRNSNFSFDVFVDFVTSLVFAKRFDGIDFNVAFVDEENLGLVCLS